MNVQLDDGGNVIGIFARPQPDISVQLADNDPRIGEFQVRQNFPERLGKLLATGCQVSSSTMPVLNTIWALDSTTMDQIGSVARDSAAGLGLPLGAEVFQYPDKAGAMVTMTGAQIQALYKALRDYMAQVMEFLTGRMQNLPAQPWIIP